MSGLALSPDYLDDPGAQAAARLFSLCFRHRGSSTYPIADFLVSLYNADYARPDMYLLCRRLDYEQFIDVMTVMGWFRCVNGSVDIHQIFAAKGDKIMASLMELFGIKVVNR